MAHDPETWAAFRPDVIGTVEVGYDDGACTAVMYFSSEAEACSGERLEVPLEWRAAMDEMDKISVEESEFLDLKQPLMRSAPRST
jgi:alanine racemase